MLRTLYELAHVESPFVWRAKYALAHKGLPYETERVAFTDIPKVLEGRSKTVPVLSDENGNEISDSWAIAEYLDQTYSHLPPLLGTAANRAKEIDGIMSSNAFPGFFPLYVRDIWASLPEDQAVYFKESREARFGATLEDIGANRDERLPAAQSGVEPLRDALGEAPWLHGDMPGYGDHIALAFFVWIKSVATTPPLAFGDPLLDWINRGFAHYDGIATDVAGGPLAG
ncbi:MAG: glutathione S-transferase N-terminal domain-containing protein [Pseudomonadota bacterium]